MARLKLSSLISVKQDQPNQGSTVHAHVAEPSLQPSRQLSGTAIIPQHAEPASSKGALAKDLARGSTARPTPHSVRFQDDNIDSDAAATSETAQPTLEHLPATGSPEAGQTAAVADSALHSMTAAPRGHSTDQNSGANICSISHQLDTCVASTTQGVLTHYSQSDFVSRAADLQAKFASAHALFDTAADHVQAGLHAGRALS